MWMRVDCVGDGRLMNVDYVFCLMGYIFMIGCRALLLMVHDDGRWKIGDGWWTMYGGFWMLYDGVRMLYD